MYVSAVMGLDRNSFAEDFSLIDVLTFHRHY